MPTPFPPEVLTSFRAIAEVVYTGDSHEAFHESLCRAAVALVDGCDHASLMLSRRGRVFTAAASDDVARRCDALEIELGQGPCIEAIEDPEPDEHICADLDSGSSWPLLAARIREETQVRGMAGFRLRQDGQKVGALNVFSDAPDRFTGHSLDQASVLSAFASVALVAVDRGEEASTLRRGLHSNREIGKAVGLLMAMHDIDDDQAFEMMSKVSQEMNVKVAEVASQVLAHHRAGPRTETDGPPPPPVR